MARNLRTLIGMPVICDGKKLGRVAQAAVSDNLTRMKGLWVDAGLFGTRFLPSEEISVIGDVAVVADTPGKRKKMRERPIFLRAISTDGERLGAIVGAYVDEISFLIVALELSSGYPDDFMRGRQKIRDFSADRRRAEAIVSPDGKEEKRDAQRDDEGSDDGGAAGRRGGDDLRDRQLEDGAEMAHTGAQGRTLDGEQDRRNSGKIAKK